MEAALIMTILLPVLVAIMYAGFYLHDRGVMQGAVCETAAMASNLRLEQNREALLQKRIREKLEHRLLWTRLQETGAALGKKRVSVTCRGTFAVPGLIARLMSGNSLELEAVGKQELYQPADMIRKIRGAEYIIDTIRE